MYYLIEKFQKCLVFCKNYSKKSILKFIFSCFVMLYLVKKGHCSGSYPLSTSYKINLNEI